MIGGPLGYGSPKFRIICEGGWRGEATPDFLAPGPVLDQFHGPPQPKKWLRHSGFLCFLD
jgi:hypothetical protein